MKADSMHGKSEAEKVVHLHTPYALYWLDEQGNSLDEPFLRIERPQDWGHPRWKYYCCEIKVTVGGVKYVHHCHIWHEIDFDGVEPFQVMAQSLFLFLSPGFPAQLCDRSALDDEDIWVKEFGERPPYFDEGVQPTRTSEVSMDDPESIFYCWRVWHSSESKMLCWVADLCPSNPPFPGAVFFAYLTPASKTGHKIRMELSEPLSGRLYICGDPGVKTLDPTWQAAGWKLAQLPPMRQL